MRPDHVSEANVWDRVSGSPEDALAEGCEQDVEEVRLFLLVVPHGAADLRVLLESELKLCDANRYIFQTLDGLQVLRLHLPPHLLKLDGLAAVDVADDPAPSVDALQVLRAAANGVSLGAHAVAQEAPHLLRLSTSAGGIVLPGLAAISTRS